MKNRIEKLRELIDKDFEEVAKQKPSIPEISDEEIEDRASDWMDEDWDIKSYFQSFIDGAKWYREQLKSKS